MAQPFLGLLLGEKAVLVLDMGKDGYKQISMQCPKKGARLQEPSQNYRSSGQFASTLALCIGPLQLLCFRNSNTDFLVTM